MRSNFNASAPVLAQVQARHQPGDDVRAGPVGKVFLYENKYFPLKMSGAAGASLTIGRRLRAAWH